MVTSELGACEWFVWDLRRSNLIDRGQLDQVIGEFLKRNPRAEPPQLAEYLVSQEVLTGFQSTRILEGKTQGLVLGPYVLLDSIGSGSMGQVYKAINKTDNQLYAIKVLPRRSMWNVRLARRQVRAFGQFVHNAVVPFVDVGTSGGLHYLCWPLVSGETLEAMVQRLGKLTPEQTAQIGMQIAQGLAICHQNGLFHGLLKPSNVLIGGDGQSRILDFGIGSLLVENEGESLVDTMSASNTLTSGLDCASPESIMEPTNRTPAGDQYSLGCTLYFCLSGRFPFPEGSAVEKMMSHQSRQPDPISDLVPDLPREMVNIVERLMQKSPDNRYTTADEIVEALQPLLSGSASPRRPVNPTRPNVRATTPVSSPAKPTPTGPAYPAPASPPAYVPPVSQQPPAPMKPAFAQQTQQPYAPQPPFGAPQGGAPVAGQYVPQPPFGTPQPLPGNPLGAQAAPNRGMFQQTPQPTMEPQPVAPQDAQWDGGNAPGGWVPEEKPSAFNLSGTGFAILVVVLAAAVFVLGLMFFKPAS